MNRNRKYLAVGILVFIVVLSLGCIDIEIKDSGGGSPEATSPQTTSLLEGNQQRILLIVEENGIAKASSIYDILSEEGKAINVEVLPTLSNIKIFYDAVVAEYESVDMIIILDAEAIYNLSMDPSIEFRGTDVDIDTLVDWVIGKSYPPQSLQGDQVPWDFRADLLNEWFTWCYYGRENEITFPQTIFPPITTQPEITFLEGNQQRILLIVEENGIAKASSIYDIRSEEGKAINVGILPTLSNIRIFYDAVASEYGSVGKMILFSTNALYNSISPNIYIKDILKGTGIDRDTLVNWITEKSYPPQSIQGDQVGWEFRGDLLNKWFAWCYYDHERGKVIPPIKVIRVTNDNTTFFISIENNTRSDFVSRESFVCGIKVIEEYGYRYCAGSDVRQIGGEDSFVYGIYVPDSEIRVVVLDSSENEIANGVAEAGTNINITPVYINPIEGTVNKITLGNINQIEVTVDNIISGKEYIIIIRAEGITTIEKCTAL